jgi:GNAT superfamily N-acetyltransferase
MIWTPERRREAALRAPIGRELYRDDSQWIERPGWMQLVTPSAPGTFLNEILLSQVADEDAEGVIDEVLADHRARRRPVKWCVGHWTRPADLGQRLERRGFVRHPVRAMGCETARIVDVPAGVGFVAVDEQNLETYLAIEARGWGLPADQIPLQERSYLAAIAAQPRTAHFFAATLHGAMVGTCGVFLRDGYGYLVGSQVLERARGKGIYRALVAARLAFLREIRFELAVTHARDATSAPMLEHLGFETIYPYDVYCSPEHLTA